MNDLNEVLNFVDDLVYAKTGERFNDLQRIILQECWQDTKKTYDRIAIEYDYSANYIKQGVGPKLWRLMSQAMGERVTKSNFNAVVTRHLSRQATPEVTVATVPVAETNVAAKTGENKVAAELELPLDSVPLGSAFYVERKPHEARCYQEILHTGSFIRIKAPRQMGKSSLMHRIINYAQEQEFQTALIHLQQAESSILDDLERFLKWFCSNLARQLGLKTNLAEYWDEFLGAKMSCTYYLQEYILSNCDRPLVIALEEVNEIIEHPAIAQEFLTLIRFWHEKTKTDRSFQQLRLIMVHSTEIYIPLDINQSPLNVGLRIELQPFDRQQVADLVARHSLQLTDPELEQLLALTGVYPYLTRRALYHLARKDLSFSELLKTAATDSGIYSDRLHSHLRALEDKPELVEQFKMVLEATEAIQIEQIAGFKLQSMGLIEIQGNLVTISCDLYQRYFSERF